MAPCASTRSGLAAHDGNHQFHRPNSDTSAGTYTLDDLSVTATQLNVG